jgi:multicomponent Na+:H+ antiporter subunit G
MIGLILIFAGSIISVIGALGLVRFPDIYTRTHAQTVVNVGGTCLILLGVFFQAPFLSLYSSKSILLIAFIFLTSPVGSHAIARAAYKSGVKPRKLQQDELGYKIDGTKPPEKEKAYEKPKQKKYKFKPSISSRAKERIKALGKKDDW